MKISLKAPQIKVDRHQRDSDNLLNNLKSKTPAQAEQWVLDNVNNLAEAKMVLGKMAKAITYILRNHD